MAPLNERYLTDAEGNRIAVVLDMETYERLLDAAEELEDIQAYVAAKARIANDELVPVEQAIAEFEQRQGLLEQPAS